MKKWVKNKYRFLLSIAGFDPVNSAGISSDIRLIDIFKIRVLSVITSIVVQDDREVVEKIDIKENDVVSQVKFYLEKYPVYIVNIGIINNLSLLKSVLMLTKEKRVLVVFDPILYSGSGNFDFFDENEIFNIKCFLSDIHLFTPNIPEFEKIFDVKIENENIEDLLKQTSKRYNIKNTLLKGGHSKGKESYDYLFISKRNKIIRFRSKLRKMRVHGTGSFYNSLISSFLLNGFNIEDSVKLAKKELDMRINEVENDFKGL